MNEQGIRKMMPRTQTVLRPPYKKGHVIMLHAVKHRQTQPFSVLFSNNNQTKSREEESPFPYLAAKCNPKYTTQQLKKRAKKEEENPLLLLTFASIPHHHPHALPVTSPETCHAL